MKKWDIITLVITMFMVATPLLFWNQLNLQPDDKIPTHFNIRGNPDSWIPAKKFPMLVLWMELAVVAVWGVRFIYPKREKVEQFRRAYNAFVVVFGVVLGAILTASVLDAVGKLNASALVMPAVGVLLIVAGVVTYISRQNWVIGFRTPWGLESEKAWKASNKIAGITMAISGVLLGLSGTFREMTMWAFWILIAGLGVAAVAAYGTWRREKHGEE